MIGTPSPDHIQAATVRQSKLVKPPGALGLLEDVAIWLAGCQSSVLPRSRPASLVIFGSDHPVAELGVSAYPRDVTPAMLRTMLAGGAASTVLARRLGVDATLVDVGVAIEVDDPSDGQHATLIRADRRGVVGELRTTPAMDGDAREAAIEAGRLAVEQLDDDTRLLLLGEMGIGNTTPAAALAGALLGKTADEIVGPGTGVEGPALDHKRQVVQAALDRCKDVHEPLELLGELGGREIAALAGAMWAAAERRIPTLVDGFIVSSAALLAVRHRPELRPWLWFGHRSAEPGHRLILDALEAQPLIDAGLRLGEGTGALSALPLVDAAVDLHVNMATFDEAAVPNKDA